MTMSASARRACMAVGLVALTAGPATAQGCRPELVRAGHARQREIAPQQYHQFLSGGVFIRCVGQPATTLRSDSLAWYSDIDRMDFVGNVRFQDDTVRLTAHRASYYPADERLDASGGVELVNRLTGTRLAGPTLSYWRAVHGVRDTAELRAAGRPTVEYRTGRDTSRAPYVIVADRVRLRGSTTAAAGVVAIERDDLAAAADSAVLDVDAGTGELSGHARASSRDSAGYTIAGRNIAYQLDNDDQLRWVQARGDAEAVSSDWRVLGDTIEFDIAADQVQGGRVWGTAVRPEALSARHTVRGDSLAIDSPHQELREVRAYGQALATARRAVDATEVDWVAGDTVVARFEASRDGSSRELTLLEAAGGARAYYHVFEQGADSLRTPAIAYSRGRRIHVAFADGELARVQVVDAADGVYLEPLVRRP